MKNAIIITVIIIVVAVILFFFSSNFMSNFQLKSAAFKPNELIPAKFTCDGENINPLLEIKGVPENAKSLVLIMDDPDATRGQTWDHWLVFNIDPKTQYIEENNVPAGAIQGNNSWPKTEYGGPCPPKGSRPHRYMFKLYALDTMLDLEDGVTKDNLEKAMTGHILEQAVLIGLYQRI